jgi:hypothetical protein
MFIGTFIVLALIFMLVIRPCLVAIVALSAGIRYSDVKIAYHTRHIAHIENNLKMLKNGWFEDQYANGISIEKANRRWAVESQFVEI